MQYEADTSPTVCRKEMVDVMGARSYSMTRVVRNSYEVKKLSHLPTLTSSRVIDDEPHR